jgi:NAD(P)-dependent dehydrogenase (short-subunit alcohol dehydrogenase family)
MNRAIISIRPKHRGPDIVVNNTAAIPRRPFHETTDEDWRSVRDSNLTAFFASHARQRLMVRRQSGDIIIVSSIMGMPGRANIPAPARQRQVCRGRRARWPSKGRSLGVTVNALAPGFFLAEATDLLEKKSQFNAWIASRVIAGQPGGTRRTGGVSRVRRVVLSDRTGFGDRWRADRGTVSRFF